MRWYYQKKNSGIGDFVSLTPSICTEYKITKKLVPVYFENEDIQKLYEKCNFIKALDSRPKTEAVMSTRRAFNKNFSQNKYKSWHMMVHGQNTEVSRPYVPNDSSFRIDKVKNKKYIALIHGRRELVKNYKFGKDIRKETRQNLIDEIRERDNVPVILGNDQDYDNFWKHNNLDGCLNFLNKLSLQDSIGALFQCNAFVSNDTGLYHIASALNMRGMTFWRDTSCKQHKNPFDSDRIKHITDASKRHYPKYIKEFLNDV